MKVMGLALVAMLAFSGIAAGSALASTPTFEPKEGEVAFPVPFEISGDGGAMETVGENRVECDATEGSGQIASSTRATIAELRFTGCSDPATGATCTTPGESSGEILTEPGNADLRYTGPNDDIAALWVWPQSGKGQVLAEFSCSLLFFSVDVTAFATAGEAAPDGGFVCPITPVNEFTTTSTVNCEQEGGVADTKVFADPETCDDVQDWFESTGDGAIGGWARQESALEGEVTNSTGAEEVRINATQC